MAAAARELSRTIAQLGTGLLRAVIDLGDFTAFVGRTFNWMFRSLPSVNTIIPNLYTVGVLSVPVIALTGTFIGMVLAVQTYSQFQQLGFATRIGSIINLSVVRELGPVLAATMLAGRLGSAMAAELATMRITDQIDALDCLGVNPVQYLVVPRFLACVLLIPVLTLVADFMGVMGAAAICIEIYQIEPHHYWAHSRDFVGLWDVITGVIKPTFFGGAIALISCYRGFHSTGGAEGVGRAATKAFVASFIAILVIDFFLALFLNALYDRLWPSAMSHL
jgi:phospholipid/cholesterol/gamma-HCH transport system permease protein